MGWKTYNDRLALWLLIAIPAVWIAQTLTRIQLAGEVNGVLIATWTLVVQYYFRKSPPPTP